MIKQDKQDYKPNFTQVKQAERDKGSVVVVVLLLFICVCQISCSYYLELLIKIKCVWVTLLSASPGYGYLQSHVVLNHNKETYIYKVLLLKVQYVELAKKGGNVSTK